MEYSKYPTKIRILMMLRDDGEQWTSDLADKVIGATGKTPNKRSRKSIKSYLVEMDMRGVVEATGSRDADSDFYQAENVVECKYRITDKGLELLKKVV